MAPEPITLTISADNIFSDPLNVSHVFNFSLVTSDFIGVVTLQRRFNSGDTWRDVNTFKDSFEGWDAQPGGGQLRFGVKTGDYTSGRITGRLGIAFI